jgi:hypothetical protein
MPATRHIIVTAIPLFTFQYPENLKLYNVTGPRGHKVERVC